MLLGGILGKFGDTFEQNVALGYPWGARVLFLLFFIVSFLFSIAF